MDMDMMASAFSRLPYFSPNMMINRSETCTTRKLLQCMDFGINMNDISDKFAGDQAPDLTLADFRARKAIVQQVESWCAQYGEGPQAIMHKWAPILYKYEIMKTSAKTEHDWGHLLFTDMTLCRFMLVMTFPQACQCGNLSHHDYGALARCHADRIMSLLVYLHEEWGWENPSRWVRATYVTPTEGFRLSSDFFDNSDMRGENRKAGRPPIYVVTPDNFNPTLLAIELEKIDNTVARGATSKDRKGASARDKVLGTKEDRPEVSSALKHKNLRQCAFCKKVKETKQLNLCSGCKLTWYSTVERNASVQLGRFIKYLVATVAQGSPRGRQ